LPTELGQAVPCNAPKPFDPLDVVAVAVLERLIYGDGKIRYGLATRREFQVGVAADVS
jgi:hypothetical protein